MASNETIKVQSLKSIKWVSLGIVLPKLISPLITVVLANLLLPKDFGVISLCSALISFFTLIQGLGFLDYIIKETKISDETLYTAFWGNLLVSILFYFVLLMLIPVLVLLYSTTILSAILPILGLNLILNAIGLVPNALLRKGLKFKKLFFIQFAPMLINVCVVIPLAYWGYGIWALIIGSLLQTAIVNIFFLISLRWLPKVIFIKNEFLQMFKFGKFVLIEQLIEFVYANLDILLLSYFLDMASVGVYFLAKTWILIIFNTLNSPINTIVYPSLHNFRNQFDKIQEIFSTVERRMIFLNAPVIIVIMLLSPAAVSLFLPEKWENVSLVLSIVVIGEGVARNLSIQRDIFKVLDKPEVYPKAFLINLIFAAISFPIAAEFGLLAFCLVRMLNDFLYTFVQMYVVKRILGFDVYDFWKISKTALISGLTMGGIIFIVIKLFALYDIDINYFSFFMILCVGITVYIYILETG